MEGVPARPRISTAHFARIVELLHAVSGIRLREGKEDLVCSRLGKRLRLLGLSGFQEYLALIEKDASGVELTIMVDLLTTNKTSFFREPQHFDYLRRQVLPDVAARDRRTRFWSAGCSSGEEPYTLAMVLIDAIPNIERRDVRILATDISDTVLASARQGVYSEDGVNGVPPTILRRHFARVDGERGASYRVRDHVRRLVSFARLNLMARWPLRGPFDAIFCRNVMIYFERETQIRLAERFAKLLGPGGHLFIGHSESLTQCARDYRLVVPAVYRKTEDENPPRGEVDSRLRRSSSRENPRDDVARPLAQGKLVDDAGSRPASGVRQ